MFEWSKLFSSLSLKHEEMVRGLLQNCDLPPPIRVYSSWPETKEASQKLCWQEKDEDEDKNRMESEKLELLKALRLSQKRAREAEEKYAVLSQEKEAISNMLLQESMQCFASRRLVKLLELQVSILKRQKYQEAHSSDKILEFRRSIWRGGWSQEEDEKHQSNLTWVVTVVLCLGMAGLAMAF